MAVACCREVFGAGVCPTRAISGDGNYLPTVALYFGFLFLEFSFQKFVGDFSGIIGLFMTC
jgi:hypothetical protein